MAELLSKFISQIKEGGLARQNRFTVELSIPSGMPNLYKEFDIVHLFCEQATLPGIAVITQPIRTYGEIREMVSDRTFENITLTFLVDSKMLVKKVFDEWMDIVINPVTRLAGYYDQYATTMFIRVQDTQNRDTYVSVLHEAYPKSIQAISLDNNSKDVMRLAVTFAYKNHYNYNEGINDISDTPNTTKIQLIKDNEPTLQEYARTAMSMDSTTNELYYSNNQEYQQRINDNIAYNNAIRQLQRQGIETNIGVTYS